MTARLCRTLAAGALVILTACQTTGQADRTSEAAVRAAPTVRALSDGRPALLEPYYRAVVVEGKRNAVLNWMRVGKAALDLGRDDLAAEAFDKALAGIEEVYADNPQAEKARSVWHAESVKDFKGEPHERAMAYYYRGLIYLMAGDYENARASFRGAMLQDGFAETERFRQDFAVAAWLDGWSSRCLGEVGQADEAFRDAASLRPALKAPDPGDDLLVVAETGLGPAKEAYGQYREKLAYRERAALQADVLAKANAAATPMAVAEDLFFQATTRGGRDMDKVLAVKADTKMATGAAGAGATVAGAGVMTAGAYGNDRNAVAAGAIVMLAGLIAQAAAQSMNAEVDTRSWDDLPHSILLASLKGGKAASAVDVTFADGTSAVLQPDRVRRALAPTCALAWFPASAMRLSPPPPPVAATTTAVIPAQTGGNCRTSAGTVVTLEPTYCRGINGVVLAASPR
ncbi:hypothetical protein D9623_02460 [Azospirillum brasilense]|uniref:Tetratricopeptide repeat protein n=1 Tax=Azospirillum brasilense TaxID=192 RepID=A0A0P0EKA7_AZOBR|nr:MULTISPECIES: hypothetical protein [Azospirillum]ALJ36357.1 hypothetical protein AMK58_13565 [Azospirillum brasilense]MDW7556987.1 hypothetical protein [Azospirillum brasilense]MDW7591644.1 hypothetical protein [Azospirillum brasilense]MDW7632335.1 hypothetical protein [Azospirillum brasilense]MDX5952452.1 hypothetical protein [Azospirillum brasilense]